MQILVAVLIALVVLLQYLLWIAEDGVRQTYALRIASRRKPRKTPS